MNDCPRRKLIEFVRAESSALLTNPQAVHEILQAACSDCPREVLAISIAMREGLPGSLVTAAANPATQWTEYTTGWVQRLQAQEQMPPYYAAWALESWALALGIAIGPVSAAPVQLVAPAAPAQAPPVAVPPEGIPVLYQPAATPPSVQMPAKSSKTGPLALVLVLVVVTAGCVYFFMRSRFDGALSGAWQSTMSDGAEVWTRTWQVSAFGGYQVADTLNDSGGMDGSGSNHVLILQSNSMGRISVPFSFSGQEKVTFTGPPLGPDGGRAWDWGTKDRGVPPPEKLTFVGTWVTSAPQRRLTGSMSLIIGYDASYKLTADYRGGGKLQAKGGAYTIYSDTGAQIDTGTYMVSGSDKVVFKSADAKKTPTTWTRVQN
jgi:hypothetical protein